MKLLDLLRKTKILRFYAGFAAAGLFIGILSIVALVVPQGEFIPVEATIVRIDESYDPMAYGGDGGMSYTVYVRYRAEGQWYDEAELGAYSSGMQVGDTVNIKYSADDPSLIQAEGAEKVPYITAAVGLVTAAVSIFFFVKYTKKPVDSFNEYDRVDKNLFPSLSESIKNSNENTNKYYFRFDRKLKQGYILEDKDKNIVYEARPKKINLIKPMEFDFINYKTGLTQTKMIGHTVSKSIGTGDGFSYRVPISCSFTIDDMNNWDYLASRGYGFDFYLEGIKPCFAVKHYSVRTANIETSGVNLHEDDKKTFGNIPVNGFFRIECRDSELDDIFMVAFSISRAVFYENN